MVIKLGKIAILSWPLHVLLYTPGDRTSNVLNIYQRGKEDTILIFYHTGWRSRLHHVETFDVQSKILTLSWMQGLEKIETPGMDQCLVHEHRISITTEFF